MSTHTLDSKPETLVDRLLECAASTPELTLFTFADGDDGSGESHFTVIIEAAAFADASRVERQRMVNRALGDIPGERVHALAIQASAPTA